MWLVVVLAGCLTGKSPLMNQAYAVKLDTLVLYDESRNREIPVAIYQPQTDKAIPAQQVVIFSHGYYANKAGGYTACSYLTSHLASMGYFVISIQHELPTDSLIPSAGIPQVVRRPFWERGVKNIQFVLNHFKQNNPELDYKHLTLIGHSNGGDMSMLFGQLHPNQVGKIISLDNRRVAFPRTTQPRIYSLRSSDQPADDGVIPTTTEQEKYQIKVIKLANIRHSDMDNSGSDEQKREIIQQVIKCLND